MGGSRSERRSGVKINLAFITIAFLALPLSNLAVAQSKADAGSSTIISLETKWNDAYKRADIATMGSLLAEDFVITVEDGSTFSKPGYLAHNGDTTVRVELSEMTDLKVRIHGNVAIVTGAYHEKGTSKGKPYESRDRLTDIWMKTNGAWQVVAAHYSIPMSE